MSKGIKGRKRIKIAFLTLGSLNWAGGVHYLRNLLYGISVLNDRRIEPYVFVGPDADELLVDQIKPYATVVRSSVVERRSLAWFVWKILFLLTGSNLVINRLMKRHGIDVVSHSNIWGRHLPYKVINWIPDFQHLHLPMMFSKKDLVGRSREFVNVIKGSDLIVLSSKDAAQDLEGFMPGYEHKVCVLNFVSQPELSCFIGDRGMFGEIEKKYAFKSKFFYLPNQFWRHKNHGVVFEAVKILKNSGLEILLLCSGHMDDFRNKGHAADMKDYIVTGKLEKNIRLLGLIDYGDVFILMRNSIAVINPSLFEGWSSTVEEAKSMGKEVILSDLAIHREQAPLACTYFKPDDPKGLAAILKKQWEDKKGGPDFELEQQAREMLPRRTRDFGRVYQNMVLGMFK